MTNTTDWNDLVEDMRKRHIQEDAALIKAHIRKAGLSEGRPVDEADVDAMLVAAYRLGERSAYERASAVWPAHLRSASTRAPRIAQT
jgi:hypothetical protein